jgi:uncharacterized OB-fold protein
MADAAADRPVPTVDRDSLPWWEALARHEFVLQRCAACQTWRWPARAICNRCSSFDWDWQPASGAATVASWVVTHHAFLPGFAAPYAVLTVRLAEQDDLLLIGGLAGSPDDARLAIDAPVQIAFDDVEGADPARTLLQWKLT